MEALVKTLFTGTVVSWAVTIVRPISDENGHKTGLASPRVIKDRLTSGIELHEQIEIRDIAREYDATIPGRCEKDQRIVECFAAFVLAIPLQPRNESSENAGFAPCFPIWC